MDRLVMIITEQCNMKCEYCYEKKYHNSKYMTVEAACNMIDFYIENNDSDTIFIAFFGGEPILNTHLIVESLKYMIVKGKELNKKVGFTINSNCTIFNDDIEEIVKLCVENNIENYTIMLSIDGFGDILNKNRPQRNGVLPWDNVEINLKKYIALMKKYDQSMMLNLKINSVITKFSLPYMYDIYEYFISIGFFGFMYKAVQDDPWEEKDVLIYQEQLDKISTRVVDLVVSNGYDMRYNAAFEVLSKLQIRKDVHQCWAGLGCFTCDTEGNLYPCQLMHFSEWKVPVGNYRTGIDKVALDKFLEYDLGDVTGVTKCTDCKNTLCDSVCVGFNFICEGDINLSSPQGCKMRAVECQYKKVLYDKLKAAGITMNNPIFERLGWC